MRIERLTTNHSSPTTQHSPLYRNFVHFSAFVVFAPVLGWLADPRNHVPHAREKVAGFLVLITLVNLLILPRTSSGRLIRRGGQGRPRYFGEGADNGPWLYPLTLAFCFWMFPPFAAMGAWAAMAAGDAAASLVGRRFPKPRLPWNRNKSLAGLVGFVLAALPMCLLALWWCPSQQFLRRSGVPEWPFVWTLGVLAADAGALLESAEGPLNDNVRVPLGVSVLLWLAGGFLSYSTRNLPALTHVQPEIFLHALIVNGILAFTVIVMRFADIPGTLLGAALGVVIYFFTGWQGYVLFFLFVALGSALSKLGMKTKAARGVVEAREGRRGINNVAANLSVPALCCLAYPASGGNPLYLIAYGGAIAAVLADTASSEIGTLSARQPVLITNFKPVAHGTNGAVSILGTFAAVAASALVAAAGWYSGFWALILKSANAPSTYSVGEIAEMVTVAGVAGTLIDSLLGATIEDRWPGIGKGAVNFACALCGAIFASCGLVCMGCIFAGHR
ncbi:MAG TPA: DUF92 domain-containing protein [Planctomycetota bacterium]